MNSDSSQISVWLSASYAITVSSIRRLIMTWQTAICLVVLMLLCGLALLWQIRRGVESEEFVQQILGSIFITIFVPLVALCFGTASIGRERDSRTLVYLISTPTPRPFVYLSKFLAGSIVSLAWACLGYLALVSSA